MSVAAFKSLLEGVHKPDQGFDAGLRDGLPLGYFIDSRGKFQQHVGRFAKHLTLHDLIVPKFLHLPFVDRQVISEVAHLFLVNLKAAFKLIKRHAAFVPRRGTPGNMLPSRTILIVGSRMRSAIADAEPVQSSLKA
jgi:hypothetical protein